jgi:hypothetical protein
MNRMNQVIKFPDMRPPRPTRKSGASIPTPAEYRRTVPAYINTDSDAGTGLFQRKRLLLWFGVAVGLHAALFLGIWLTPPLRLVWGPSSDAWVSVTSVPEKIRTAPQIEPVKAPIPIPMDLRNLKALPVQASRPRHGEPAETEHPDGDPDETKRP